MTPRMKSKLTLLTEPNGWNRCTRIYANAERQKAERPFLRLTWGADRGPYCQVQSGRPGAFDLSMSFGPRRHFRVRLTFGR